MNKIRLVIGVCFMLIQACAAQSIEQANTDYYTQVCERFIACGNTADVAESATFMRIKDTPSCVRALTSRDSAEHWRSLLNEKKLAFRPNNQAICMQAISELTCKQIGRGITRPSDIAGCETFVAGTTGLGSACTGQSECGPGTMCDGTCKDIPLLQCGEESCSSAQICDYKSQSCVTPKKVGEFCTNFSECESRSCGDGICKAGAIVSKSGGSCEAGFVCPLGEECEGTTCKPW